MNDEGPSAEELQEAQVAIIAKLALQEARITALEEYVVGRLEAAAWPEGSPPPGETKAREGLRRRTRELADRMLASYADEEPGLASALRRMLDEIDAEDGENEAGA